jgi:HlyD family secretion protein
MTGNTLVVHPADFLQQVSVSGKVVAAQNVDLGFSQSGRVARVNARVGDTVRAGTLLAEVENGDVRATVLQKQAALESQRAKLASLKAGTRPETLAIAQSAVDSGIAALNQANQGVVNAIRDAYTKSDDAIRNKVDQFVSNPRGVSPQVTFFTSASQLAITVASERAAVEQMLHTWQTDVSSLNASSDLATAGARAQTSITSVVTLLLDASAVLNQAIPSQGVSQTSINQYSSDIAGARTSVNAAAAALNTAITAQKSAAAALDSARKNLALEMAGATGSDIEAQAAQVAAAQADLENAQAQLTKTRITAPFDGIVTKMDAKVGEIISPNTSETSLIGAGAFQIESYVPEINVALIQVGNAALVTLDAYGTDTPFDAKIVSIDPAETVKNGVSMYRTILQFNAQDPRIRSGMTANVVITTEKKIGVISVPQGVVKSREGKKYVQVVVNEKANEREVTTGDVSSLGNVEILSGLNDGDVVLLTP